MDNNKNSSKDNKKNKYQDVLDQYAAKVDPSIDETPDIKTTDLANDTVKMTETTPAETPVDSPVETPIDSPVETPIDSPVETPVETPEVPPEIPSLENSSTPNPALNINETEKSATPEELKDKINEVLNYETDGPEQEPVIPISDSSNSSSNLIKMLFFISLSVFILIAVALAYFSFFKNSDTSNDNQVTPTITSTPTSSEIACTINDMELTIGEDFIASDGCNICVCEAKDLISCTEKTCDATSSAIKTATSSAEFSVYKRNPQGAEGEFNTDKANAINSPLKSISITFNNQADSKTINNDTFYALEGIGVKVDGKISYDNKTKTATITFTNPAINTDSINLMALTVVVKNIKDINGNLIEDLTYNIFIKK